MRTRKSRHNKGRKPFYKDHGSTAALILSRPRYMNNGWLDARLNWRGEDLFALDILAEADADIEGCADALARPPSSIAYKAREMGFTLPREWARLLDSRRTKKPKRPDGQSDLKYPYIQNIRPEHADIVEINKLIPSGIPDHMRSDMCQEIMLAVLEGRTTIEALRSRSRSSNYFIRKFYKDNFEDGGRTLSFNTAGNNDDEEMAARSIASKEWHYGQLVDRHSALESFRATSGAVQLEACFNDQVGRVRFDLNRAGMFLTHDEVEAIMSDDNYAGVGDFERLR